jgi:hypothetical protein
MYYLQTEYGEHLDPRANGFEGLLALLKSLTLCVTLKYENGRGIKVLAKDKAESSPSFALPSNMVSPSHGNTHMGIYKGLT